MYVCACLLMRMYVRECLHACMYVRECLLACMSVHRMCVRCLWRPVEGSGSPGSGFADNYGLPHACRELSLGLGQEQHVL